jgi:two-component system nitrogen regulation sensor histidine kinase NtrY
MFSLLSLVLVAFAAGLTYWLASSALVSELEERTDGAADRVEAYLALRGENARQAVVSLAGEAALRRTLAGVASGREEPASPLVVGLAEESMAGTDLDVLEILDAAGTVLSSAHWKASYGNPHADAVSLARETGGAPAAVTIDVRGSSRISLVSALPVRVGASEFFVVGGYYLDTESIRDLKNLLDVDVMLVTLQGAPESGKHEDNQTGSSKGSMAAGQGGSVSKTTHVLREVFPPHTGEPVAKFVVGVSRARLQGLSAGLRRAFLYAAAAALVFSWIVALLLARGTTRRLERLTAGARRVAAGDLETPVAGEGDDEVGQLVSSFNKMLVDLKDSRSRSARMERIAAWREVARRIAHEIKNALSPIQLSIENIQRSYSKGGKDFENVLSRATKTVREEVDGLREIVDEFSQLARMPAPTLVKNDLRQVAQRVVSLQENARRGVNVELSTPPGPVEAEIDPGLLSRALGNIVANALEACGDGGRVTVAVEASGESDCVRIVVKDDGAGLAPDQLERIFEPYYTTREDGTGLGLAIVMKIVTDHGGNVEVESEPGRGSVFSIVLPAVKE